MYIVSLSYTRPMAEVEALLDAHHNWLDHYFSNGIFLAAGRKDPHTGGVIITCDIDRDRLDAILTENAFTAVASYEVTKPA
ncbi:YciI family protein [Erwinia tracheiphila]|uniref:YciI family protein n=1 Tax=Erwinia tracheiphila TaxID=65700 RepID=UPI000340DCFE|nr:YciI family protein [Erwinia tracheiphila]EOS96043.1 YCII-related domain family protein [Erwinia tracheiphila PSU-1]UIA87023.1 YciI family protein [Erwinia tracheiphila]UIA95381.1 YciI family protein [Erwinia tracheiphila]